MIDEKDFLKPKKKPKSLLNADVGDMVLIRAANADSDLIGKVKKIIKIDVFRDHIYLEGVKCHWVLSLASSRNLLELQ